MGYWINKSQRQFFRNRYLPLGFSVPILRKDRNNKGIFTTAYRYNILNPNEAELFGDLYFDFDSKDNFDAARDDAITALAYLKTVFKIDYDQVYIYFSGKKGIHIIVPANIIGVTPIKTLNHIYKAIATKVKSFLKQGTLDLIVYDNKRMLRVPYSIHEDTNLYKIELSYDELRNVPYDNIKELAKSPRKINMIHPKSLNTFAQKQYEWFRDNYESVLEIKSNRPRTTNTLKVMPPCIVFLNEHGAPEGNRNNSTAVMTSFYRSFGKTYEETLDILQEWNEKNSPPLHLNELKRTVQSIYNGQASYGCNTIQGLSHCDKAKCQLKGGKI